MAVLDEGDQIDGVVRRVTAATGATFEEVEPRVRACFAEWSEAPVRDFVPILVERFLRSELRDGRGHQRAAG